MSIVVRFAPPSPPPTSQYDETIRRLEGDGGEFPPDGLEYHIAFLVDGGIRVSEIWDSAGEVGGVRRASDADTGRRGDRARRAGGLRGPQHHQALADTAY